METLLMSLSKLEFEFSPSDYDPLVHFLFYSFLGRNQKGQGSWMNTLGGQHSHFHQSLPLASILCMRIPHTFIFVEEFGNNCTNLSKHPVFYEFVVSSVWQNPLFKNTKKWP